MSTEEFDFQADDNVHNHNFTIVYNNLIESKISPTAYRLITYMCSKPKGWKFHMHKLQEICHCGKNKLYEAFKELKDEGYLKTVAVRDGKAFKGSVRVFSNQPIYKSMEFPDFGSSINRKSHKPGVEVSNTERVSNTESNSKTSARAPASLNTKEIEQAKAAVAAFVEGAERKGQPEFIYNQSTEPLVVELGSMDISNSRAEHLIAKYGEARIKEAMAYAKTKAKTNVGGYFERTLAGQWGMGWQERKEAPKEEDESAIRRKQEAEAERKDKEAWEARVKGAEACRANPKRINDLLAQTKLDLKKARLKALSETRSACRKVS